MLLVFCASPLSAQTTITLSGTTSTLPFRDYATRQMGDPWDMSQRTDIGWFTWGVDSPPSNLVSKTIKTDAQGNTVFSAQVASDSSEPWFFLLDTWLPGVAKLGKVGTNYPIDTTVYNAIYIRMKIANDVLDASPVAQVYWSRDTIFGPPVAGPDGGQIGVVNLSGNPVGPYLTPQLSEPFAHLEGGNWVIYRIPLTIPELKALNADIDHWKNWNAGTSANWGAAGVTADSLRVSPFNLPATQVGEMQIDWARLVSYSAGSATTINWSPAGTYDIVVSTQPDCSDFSVVAYSKSSGYQFQSQVLPPGTYHVGLRLPFKRTGQTAGSSGRALVSCSSATLTVQEYPSLSLTSPSAEGSTDDFATTVLGNSWDFDALTDIDFARNANIPGPGYGIVSMAATDPAGADLGAVRVYRNRSTMAVTGVGDPHIYPLWPFPQQVGATSARGRDNRIDASRYRILTMDVGVDRTRDINLGSIARIIWHVDGEFKAGGSPAEIESSDIVLRHLDPATENGGRIVLDTIQIDMADRVLLPVETDYSQPASGWNNDCTPMPGLTACDFSGMYYKPGIDLFRLDFHEFSAATDSEVRRIKLAALERTGPAFQIRWNASNPSSLTSTITLKAVPEVNPAASDYRPVDRTCAGSTTITIASGIPLAAGSYTWSPVATAGISNGTEYYVCAQVFVGGVAAAVTEVMSKWPVVVDTWSGPRPSFALDRSTVRVAGVYAGSTSPRLSSQTSTEAVNVTQIGTGTVNWTATVVGAGGGAANWLSVTPTSGIGGGTLSINLRDDATLPSCTAVDGLTATIRLTSADLATSPLNIRVFATIYPGAGTSPGGGCTQPVGGTLSPVGLVDAPAQGVTGQVGAIGVTGWVVDDVGVRSVKIYRNCLSFEPAINCGVVNGVNVAYIGDATLVAGARPDIEALYSSYPQSYKGAWGYLLLTSMLPHLPNQQMFGGQGTLTLYVLAEDMEGHKRWLGRGFLSAPTLTDQVPTTFTMANDTIAKPFGAIDTPKQGETVSGSFWNFGWTLTPDSNTTAGAGDILMPPTGATQWVYIDGVAVAPIGAYNLCRGNVGSPPAAGVYCDDDVASIFGNPTPQPTYTARTANVTKHRNLDAGRGPIAAYFLDTTTLANGVHTIVWGVTDSAGRGEGIGSRYFTVLNGSFDARPDGTALAQDRSGDAVPAGRDHLRQGYGGPPERHAKADESRPYGSTYTAQSRGDAGALDALTPSTGRVWGRTGFDRNLPYAEVEADEAGVRRVQIPDLGRLDLWLGAVEWGYLVANGTLRDLPPGSHLDPETGQFTWAPGLGYIGTYRLTFVRGGEQVPVDVTIRPTPPVADGEREIRMAVDVPRAGDTVSGMITVAGWALDPHAWTGSGIGAVHVWAQRTDMVEAAPQFLGTAALGGVRPDVAQVYGPTLGTAGFSLTTDVLAPGQYDITVFAWNHRTARWEDARTVPVTVR